MTDLHAQLRAYGRQIEADTAHDAPTGTPGSVSLFAPQAPTTGPRRSSWLLVAAATVVIAVTGALVTPIVGSRGDPVNNTRAGIALGVCLITGACSGGAPAPAQTPAAAPAPVSSSPAAPSPSASPGAASTSTAEPPPLFERSTPEVEPGIYTVDLVGTDLQITVPAGWSTDEDFALVGPEDSFVAFFDIADVYTDACQYLDADASIGPTVEDLVAGLQAQANLETSEPKAISVDGRPATELVISPPAGLDFATCYGGRPQYWTTRDGVQIGPFAPEEVTTVWILDLDGKRGVITFGAVAPPSDATRAQVLAMVNSLRIG